MRLRHALKTALVLSALASAVAWAAPVAAFQQAGPAMVIYGVDSQSFPTVIAYLAVTDAEGKPVVGLTPADVQLLVDDQPQEGGGPVNISSYQPSLAVVLALDVSVDFASFTQVQAAAKDFVDSMGPDDQAAVVVYASDVTVAQDFTSDQASLKDAIDGLTAEGTATNLNKAVSQAIGLAQDATADRKAVIAITNGGDTVGAITTDNVIRQATDAGVPLYTMVFAPTVNVTALGNLGRQTGGRAFVLNDAGQVGDSLQTVAGDLRQGYSVTFQSTVQGDNADHTLKIIATVGNRDAEAEATFTATQVVTPITLALSVQDGQSVIGVVNLTAQVASAKPITNVQYLLDDQPLATLAAPPYTFQWDSTTTTPGSHVILARATDANGNTGEAQATLNVTEVTPLLVTASVPRSVEVGNAVTIQARVDTTVPGVTVEFLMDGDVLGKSDTSPYAFTFDSASFDAGDHNITVRATDSLGRQAQNDVSIQFTPRPVSFGEAVGNFVRSLARFKLLAFRLVLVFLMLVAFVVAIIILRMNGRTRKVRLQRTCTLEVNNTGNARSRFQLWADDAAKVLKFQFALDGEMMEVHTPAPQTVARPTQARPSAQATRPQAQPARPKSGGGSQAASKAWSLSTTITDLLNNISYLLPGSAGRAMFHTSAEIRNAQYTGSRVQSLSGSVASATGSTGAGAQASQATTVVDAPAAPMPDPTRPGPVAPPRRPGPVNTQPWVETPYIEPGETLAVNLLVDRLRTSGVQQYPFQVHSRCMEAPDIKPAIEQGVIEMGRLPPLVSLMPVIVLLATIGVVLLLLALLLFPPGFIG